jgi:hypothetical protein
MGRFEEDALWEKSLEKEREQRNLKDRYSKDVKQYKKACKKYGKGV